MGSQEGLRQLAEEIVAQQRQDLAEGRLRVVDRCYTCPFCKYHPTIKEISGNQKALCGHPQTEFPQDPVVVDIGPYAFIPASCPLRGGAITVFLDPQE